MPEDKNCIVCGSPSQTRVCMHCFFKYDHRTYNSRELEKHSSNDDAFLTSFMKNSFYATNECSMDHMDVEQDSDQDTSPQQLETGEDNSIISWFIRLPRFS